MNTAKKLLDTEYKTKNIWHNALFVLVALLMVFACFSTQSSIEWHKPEMLEYPMEDITYQSQYIQQFDAFLKGQIHLDLEVSEGLAALENPYDPTAREEADVSYYWDHAYFEGKYYSYFGIAPIVTVYYPCYLITGNIPNDSLACLVLALCAVLFSTLAYREVVMRFSKSANLWLFLGGEGAFIAVSGVYLGLLCSDIYYIAVLSALSSAMAFTFFAFHAMRRRNIPLRAAMLALAAIMLTLTVLSRPTAALMCAAVFPIFLDFLLKIKRENLREGVITVASFALPLAAGACFVMWFNAVRFGSPFDFGADYQLTVSDISKNEFEFKWLFSALFSYFMYPFWFANGAPYIVMGNQIVLPPVVSERYVYADSYVGAFAHGLPFAVMLFNRVLRLDREEGGKDGAKTAFAVLTVALAIFMAFFNFCYAGVNMRYIYDIVPMLSLVGSFILLDLHGRSRGRTRVCYAALCVLLFAVAALACVSSVETIRLRF